MNHTKKLTKEFFIQNLLVDLGLAANEMAEDREYNKQDFEKMRQEELDLYSSYDLQNFINTLNNMITDDSFTTLYNEMNIKELLQNNGFDTLE